MRQVCFRLPDAPALPTAAEPLRLGSREGEALAELLQVFACGEESAALAFQHLADARAEAVTRDALSVIAAEEAAHEMLLRSLRLSLPEPARDRSLRRALLRFYHDVTHEDAGLHLAGIAALDSAVCTIVSSLLHGAAPLTREPRVASVFSRIRREEAGHVRLSRGLARNLAGCQELGAVAEHTRHGLVEVLALRGSAFDVLGVDPDRLFADLRRIPPGLFA